MNAISRVRSQIYVTAALMTTVIAFIGFWPTYFGPLFLGTVNTTRLIHIHAAVVVAWLALFIAQIVLASTGHLALHMKIGRWTMAYSIVVILILLALSFETFGKLVAMGEAVRGQQRLFSFLRDVLFVTPFFAAGWIYRSKPETHKRLMMVATVILTLPAVSRMKFLGEPVPLWHFMLVWPLPIYVLMIYDYTKKKLIHPVYVIGIAAMLTMRLIRPLASTDTWMTISGWFVHFYQVPAIGR